MHIFLDTDIGSDVDDALALGVILGSPEFHLVGVSTVYGDTLLRARLTSKLAGIADPKFSAPVAVGRSETMSGRPVWWAGHEGKLFDDLEAEAIDESLDGVEELVSAAARYVGELVVLAIGPLTNIAAALDSDPAFEHNVKRIVIMGGDFSASDRVAEHNFVCDVAAAQRVFNSKLAITVGGLDLTTQIEVGADDVSKIASAGAFGRALEAEMSQWAHFKGEITPHDPILAIWLLEPQLFELVDCDVQVDDSGRSYEVANPRGGRVKVLTSMKGSRVGEVLVERITAATRI